jgi:hypothetical protein
LRLFFKPHEPNLPQAGFDAGHYLHISAPHAFVVRLLSNHQNDTSTLFRRHPSEHYSSTSNEPVSLIENTLLRRY